MKMLILKTINMKKEFVTYNQALRLKALGFNEPCIACYPYLQGLVFVQMDNSNDRGYWAAPTFSQAFRWFRENYNQHCHPIQRYSDTKVEYDFILNGKWGNRNYEKYEEAELACLEELIKIAEKEKEKQ